MYLGVYSIKCEMIPTKIFNIFILALAMQIVRIYRESLGAMLLNIFVDTTDKTQTHRERITFVELLYMAKIVWLVSFDCVRSLFAVRRLFNHSLKRIPVAGRTHCDATIFIVHNTHECEPALTQAHNR